MHYALQCKLGNDVSTFSQNGLRRGPNSASLCSFGGIRNRSIFLFLLCKYRKLFTYSFMGKNRYFCIRFSSPLIMVHWSFNTYQIDQSIDLHDVDWPHAWRRDKKPISIPCCYTTSKELLSVHNHLDKMKFVQSDTIIALACVDDSTWITMYQTPHAFHSVGLDIC